MKKLMVLLLCLGLLLSCAACGSSGGSTQTGGSSSGQGSAGGNAPSGTGSGESGAEAVRLKVWVPEEELEITKQMADSFAAAHPEYAITWEISITGIDESVALLETDSDTAADVFQIPSGSIVQVTNEGLLLPIGYQVESVKALYGDGAVIASTGEDGLLYGIPFSPNSFFMFYNKSLFNEDEVQSLETMLAKDLGTTADGEKIYNFSFTLHNSWYIESFFYAAGCSLFGPDGKDPTAMDWNNENGFAAGMYAINLAKNPNYLEDQDGIAGSLMNEGRLGALCSGTWSAGSIQEALGDDYAACALPTIEINGTASHLSNFADYKCYAVKSSTAHPLAAQQFAEWLCNEENQKLRYEVNAVTPTVLSLADDPELAEDPATAALLAQTEYAVAQPSITQISEYWTPAEALGTGIVHGEITEENLQQNLDALVSSVTSKLVG